VTLSETTGPGPDETRPAKPTRDALDVLRRPQAIRARCAAITRAVEKGLSSHFRLDRSKLDDAAALVAQVMQETYPDGHIPMHSQWRRFDAGGVPRIAELDRLLAGRSVAEQTRSRIDLTLISVLLGASAGAHWRYTEGRAQDALALPVQVQRTDELFKLLDRVMAKPEAQASAAAADEPGATAAPAAPAGQVVQVVQAAQAADGAAFGRSEGLAVASFRAFTAGVFSSQTGDLLRADAATLRLIDTAALRGVFQVGAGNVLVGLEGRAGVMSALGESLQAAARRDGFEARPGRLYDRLLAHSQTQGDGSSVSAELLLNELLRLLAPAWRDGTRVLGLPAGDVWQHRWAGEDDGNGRRDLTTPGWVPVHQISQWLAYSLVEPLQSAGLRVTGLEALTALPGYRSGGLLIDTGVITLRNPRDASRVWKLGDELIVEWRALTLTLLDELAERLRQRLGLDATALPLSSVLEGGTWAAGRRIAQQLHDGAPPLRIDSDGTVL